MSQKIQRICNIILLDQSDLLPSKHYAKIINCSHYILLYAFNSFLLICTKFLLKAPNVIDVLQESKEILSHCEENLDSADRELFVECAEVVKTFQSKEPFSLFKLSMYFHRYLQWKWLERFVNFFFIYNSKIES